MLSFPDGPADEWIFLRKDDTKTERQNKKEKT